MILDVIVIAILVLVCGLLLFPVKVRFLFRGEKDGGMLEVRFFHWKVFRTKEDAENTEALDGEVRTEDLRATAPLDDEVQTGSFQESADEKIEELRPEETGKKSSENSGPEKNAVQKDEPARAETSAQKKEKRSREKSGKKSDSEFLTLVLEPGFDRKLLKGSARMAKAFFRIFRCRFEPTVVEGIRLDSFAEMGVAGGALDFFAATVPLLENWEFRMDWKGTKAFRIEGGIAASFSLARILGFCLVSLRWVLELAWIYLKNRRRLRKNPKGFRLVFWRRFIVRFLSAEGA